MSMYSDSPGKPKKNKGRAGRIVAHLGNALTSATQGKKKARYVQNIIVIEQLLEEDPTLRH